MLTISAVPVKSNLHFLLAKKKTKVYVSGFLKKKLLLLGRQIAYRLTADGKTVTTRDVRRVMIAEGLYREGEAGPEYWLGFVFKGPQWKWTGEWAKYSTPSTAKHTQGAWRTVKIWQRR